MNLLFQEPAPSSFLEPSECEDECRKGMQKGAREGPEIEDAAWDGLVIDEEHGVMSMMGYSE